MLQDQDAQWILQEVHEYYASGVKSSNKAYISMASDVPVAMGAAFDKHFQIWSTRRMAEKAKKRNNNAYASGNTGDDPRDLLGGECKTLYDWGVRIYNGGKRAEFTAGNCMEMAAVAAAIAIDKFHVAPDSVYCAQIGFPGDHSFCLLSEDWPRWRTVSQMVAGSGDADAYVIDPWLNTACPAQAYWETAWKRLCKWAANGKRIMWSGQGGNSLGWYSPDGTYAQAFGHSPMGYGTVLGAELH